MTDGEMLKFGFLFFCGAYIAFLLAVAGLFTGFLIGKALL